MPIEVEIQGTGQIAEFPDGTPPEAIKAALSKYRSQSSGLPSAAPSISNEVAQPSNQAVGPSNPVPSDSVGGFDPVSGVKNAALEFMAGVNRGALSLADIPSDIANAVLQLSGSDVRAPAFRNAPFLKEGIQGGFVEDPTARQIIGTLGEFASPAPPIAAASKTGAADDIAKLFTTQSATKNKIAQEITNNPSSTKLVKYIKDGAGNVSKDKVALEAIRQGYDKGVIAAIKGATPRDRNKMSAMLDILKKGMDDATFSAKYRPADVVGQSLLERVNFVKEANSSAGKAVDAAAKSLKGKAIDVQPAMGKFLNDLNDMGISIERTASGKIKPNFYGSDIEKVKGAEGIVKNIIARLGDTKSPDAYDVHRMKKFIDEQVTYGKAAKGLGGKAERVVKSLRTSLDDILDSSFPSYNDANKSYSETIGALDSLQSAVGKSVDLFGPNADKATGTALRRLLSNTQSRANMLGAITDIEKVASSAGGKFNDDIIAQMIFADELDSVFGATARTSLKGQVAQGVRDAAGTAQGKGITEKAIDLVGGVAERAMGVNQESAIKSMEELLKRK